MKLFRRLKKLTRVSNKIKLFPSKRTNRIGQEGEDKVDSKLNPILFGKVSHRQVDNVTLVDDNGYSHQIDHIEIRRNGCFRPQG